MNSKKCKDHEGREFPSIKDMCEYYEISPRLLRNRLNNGWSLKNALLTPISKYRNSGYCY